jgi:hypothetical protein
LEQKESCIPVFALNTALETDLAARYACFSNQKHILYFRYGFLVDFYSLDSIENPTTLQPMAMSWDPQQNFLQKVPDSHAGYCTISLQIASDVHLKPEDAQYYWDFVEAATLFQILHRDDSILQFHVNFAPSDKLSFYKGRILNDGVALFEGKSKSATKPIDFQSFVSQTEYKQEDLSVKFLFKCCTMLYSSFEFIASSLPPPAARYFKYVVVFIVLRGKFLPDHYRKFNNKEMKGKDRPEDLQEAYRPLIQKYSTQILFFYHVIDLKDQHDLQYPPFPGIYFSKYDNKLRCCYLQKMDEIILDQLLLSKLNTPAILDQDILMNNSKWNLVITESSASVAFSILTTLSFALCLVL